MPDRVTLSSRCRVTLSVHQGVRKPDLQLDLLAAQGCSRMIDRQMSQIEAMRLYEATVRHGHFDDSGADQTELIDVTPNKQEDEPTKPDQEDGK